MDDALNRLAKKKVINDNRPLFLWLRTVTIDEENTQNMCIKWGSVQNKRLHADFYRNRHSPHNHSHNIYLTEASNWVLSNGMIPVFFVVSRFQCLHFWFKRTNLNLNMTGWNAIFFLSKVFIIQLMYYFGICINLTINRCSSYFSWDIV